MEATRYVWKPERPKIDQTEKKHIANSTAVNEWVKENIIGGSNDPLRSFLFFGT